jgi:two-component system, OmpR family, phosphate regulon sensor histidine kinase PhoR
VALRSSLRFKLIGTFLVLVAIVGTGTLLAIERTLANDLVSSLDARMTVQGKAVADWLTLAGHPDRLAPRLAAVTGTRITIVGADGLVQGDSLERSTVGRPIGEAPEIARARRGEVGRAIRRLRDDEPEQYLVAVPADLSRVIRLAVPLDNVIETRARMRNRLLVGGAFGFIGCLLLSWIFIRAVTRPLQSMTRTAEKLARGDYEVPALTDAGGELGVLARAMTRMAGEVKARVGELTQQRDLLSVVFGGLVEGVVVVDHGGSIVLVNDAVQPLLENDGSLPAPIQLLVRRAIAGEQADAELELSGRVLRASARPLGDPGAIVVLYDVTRMRSLEAVRREFLSNAAHELRTPVTSISGYAETLLANPVDAETSKEFLQTIHRNAERIAGLVTDLVLLDTLGGRAAVVAERVAIPLVQVVNDAARTARGVTPSAQIEIDIPAGISVLGTREGLDHVVQNLIDNAIKYGGNTKVSVTAEVIDPPPLAASASVTSIPRERVRLSIADRGPGIPKGQEERIFERFYRIDSGRSRDRGGSGLGLAIVRGQIEALGGRVWVEHGDPGARFIVELEVAGEGWTRPSTSPITA